MSQTASTNRLKLGGEGHLGARPVRRIGYGTMQLERHRADRERALGVLRAVADAGVDHLDTAQFYTGVNALIAEALGARRDALVINTKLGAVRTSDGALVPAQTPLELRAQVEENLRELGSDHLDVVYLRRLDRAPGIIARGEQIVDLDDQLAELIALREAGKLRGIGLSAVTPQQLTQALGADIAGVQNSYSLVDAGDEPVLELCREHGIAWVPFFPLGGAFPDSLKVPDQPVVRRIAAELGATPAQVGLAWLLASYQNTLLIPGTADLGHLAENIAAGDLTLAPAQIEALGALRAGDPRPGEA